MVLKGVNNASENIPLVFSGLEERGGIKMAL